MDGIFHRRIQKDLRAALAFYETEGAAKLADRFFAEAEDAAARVLRNPKSVPTPQAATVSNIEVTSGSKHR